MNFEKDLSHAFFVNNTFISNTKLNLEKKLGKAMQHCETELLLFRNYSLPSYMLPSKTNMRCSRNVQKNTCLYFNEFIWLVIMKMRLKIRNRSHRYIIDTINYGTMNTNIQNMKFVSEWWSLRAISNTYATSDAKFMKKLSNTETELKKSVAYKKACNPAYMKTPFQRRIDISLRRMEYSLF